VLVDGMIVDKPARLVARAHALRSNVPPLCQSGRRKLAAALDAFSIDPGGLVTLDVGCSTGGSPTVSCNGEPSASTPLTSGMADRLETPPGPASRLARADQYPVHRPVAHSRAG
jgi:hypothetical protein